MEESHKTKKQLLKDLKELRQRLAELKKSEIGGNGAEEEQLHREKT